MYRFFAALALAMALASCTSSGGGNPLNDNEDGTIGGCDQPLVDEDDGCNDADTGGGSTDPDDPSIYRGDVTGMTYDPDTGIVTFDGLPWDGDNTYNRNDAVSDSSAFADASSFDVYTKTNGTTTYYAVFRRSSDGYSQGGGVNTDRYITYGFGGSAAQRVSGTGALPSSQTTYMFRGEYAAVRTITSETDGSTIQYVSGTIKLDVDTEDFDDTGTVGGVIQDRHFFDTDGNELFTTDTESGLDVRDQEYISLTTGAIDFDNWTVSSDAGSAVIVANNSRPVPEEGADPADPSRMLTSGNWEAIFTGPNGEEVAGAVFVEGQGAIGISEEDGQTIILTHDTIREVGAFVARR